MTSIFDPSKTSDWYIFEPIFHVKVPAEALRTENEVRLLGTPSTGNKRTDAALSSRMTSSYMNIARMASLAFDGHPVAVVNHADCKTIFEYTQNHLDAWAKRLQFSINRPDAPFDDLQKLDRFASSVYVHARHQYNDPNNAQSGFMQAIEELGLLSEFSIFQPSMRKVKELEALNRNEAVDMPNRAPLSDLFLEAQSRR